MYYTALCVSGLYYSVLNEECRDCPGNSEGMHSGLSECPCVEGYYRASGEEDLPCTRELHTFIQYWGNVIIFKSERANESSS